MARDYARQSKSKKGSRGISKLLIFTVLLIISFILGLIYLKNHPLTPSTDKAPVPKEKQEQNKTEKRARKEPRFEFYTMLPKGARPAEGKKQIELPAAENKMEQPKTTTVPTNIQYIIQVAAFRNYDDADHMKAELALLGYQPKIEKIQNPNGTWYRVRLGPYPTQEKATEIRAELTKIHLKSVVTKTN